MNEIVIEANKALNKLISLIENEEYYLYQDLINKEELSNSYESQEIDDICDLAIELIENYLLENNYYGKVDNGYSTLCVF